jgi:hypothetical protein
MGGGVSDKFILLLNFAQQKMAVPNFAMPQIFE